MKDAAIHFIVFLNQVANAVCRVLLAPLGWLPEIPGALIVAFLTGILMLIAFKYTSDQKAIKHVRNGIKAELLALSLFKDSVAVNLGSQWRIIMGALKLILLSLIPIGCMVIPVTLLLGQLSLWWQAQPLNVGEEVVVTLALHGTTRSEWPNIELASTPGLKVTRGPIRVRSQREVCWELEAIAAGCHQLVFEVDGRRIEKDIAVGDQSMRVSISRPDWNWSDILLHPAELPFEPDDAVKTIAVQYSPDTIWLTGRYSSLVFNSWIVFWFLGSTTTAFCFSGVLKVNL